MFQYVVLPDNHSFTAVIQMTDEKRRGILKEKDGQQYNEAWEWVKINMLKYLQDTLTRYIIHASYLHHSGRKDVYEIKIRVKSLDTCRALLPMISNCNMITICLTILRIQEDLRNILPIMQNRSYGSSCDTLNELVSHAIRIKTQYEKLIKP